MAKTMNATADLAKVEAYDIDHDGFATRPAGSSSAT
jgi:hypothetical protein